MTRVKILKIFWGCRRMQLTAQSPVPSPAVKAGGVASAGNPQNLPENAQIPERRPFPPFPKFPKYPKTRPENTILFNNNKFLTAKFK
jgi:hypothetical protein